MSTYYKFGQGCICSLSSDINIGKHNNMKSYIFPKSNIYPDTRTKITYGTFSTIVDCHAIQNALNSSKIRRFNRESKCKKKLNKDIHILFIKYLLYTFAPCSRKNLIATVLLLLLIV